MFPVKQFLGRTALWLAILPLSTAEGSQRTCTIVTNGRPEIFLHELAHCNGWRHAPFDGVLMPPSEFMRLYEGRLVVIMSRRDDLQTRMEAEVSTASEDDVKIGVSQQSVADLCAKLWSDKGISADTYRPYLTDIAGCSVK
jgi:hypothetical protein